MLSMENESYHITNIVFCPSPFPLPPSPYNLFPQSGGFAQDTGSSYLCYRVAEETKNGDFLVTRDMLEGGEGPLVSLRVAFTDDDGIAAKCAAEGFTKVNRFCT